MNKKEETFESKITGAIARGYCSEENENKVLDADLCIAMVKEVMPEVQQEIDRAREDTEVDRIKWALRELPKLTEGKDFREDNWSVIVEKLKTKLTK